MRNLVIEHRNERQRQKAMGDRLAARHVLLGPLDVDVNPLVITCRLGELVDSVLCNLDPVANPNFLAHVFVHFVRVGEFPFCHFS